MDPTLSTYQRIYLQLKRADAGKVKMVFSRLKPTGGAMVALLSRGSILSDGMEVQLVTDPTADPALRGKDGVNGRDGVDGQPGTAGRNGVDGKAGSNGLDGASAYEVARALGYGGTKTQWLASQVGAAGKDGTNGLDGKNASAILGPVTIAQTATVAISAGLRRMLVTIPASWGVAAGDPLIVLPSVAVAGYALHDVVAVSPTSLSIGLTAPLLAIGASFSIPCRIARLNT